MSEWNIDVSLFCKYCLVVEDIDMNMVNLIKIYVVFYVIIGIMMS